MASVTNILSKALSPAYYSQAASNVWKASYAYYHPKFRAGSVTPLWHCMIAVSTIMYTTSYMARDYSAVRHKRAIQKEALKEYYEKHGGAPDHH